MYGFQLFFMRRGSIPLKDWTRWELIHGLQEAGGRLQPILLGKRVPPFKWDGDVSCLPPDVKTVYFRPRSLELGRSYLQCLNSLPEIQEQGRMHPFLF